MPLYLFRNSDTLIEYGVTDARSGSKLPALSKGARWQFHAEIQNAMHATVYGLMEFETAKRGIAKRGYFHFVEAGRLKIAS